MKLKQWRKSSRWRKAYGRADRRNKMRLWNLVEGEKPFCFGSGFMHVITEEDCERMQSAMIARLLTNPWLEMLSGKFPKNAGRIT